MSKGAFKFISVSDQTVNRVGIGLTATVGPTGPQGAFGGPQGYEGPQGWQGTVGYQGVQGTNGILGTTGTQGSQGPSGLQGYQGSEGAGYQGAMGPQGLLGVQGPQGSVGAGVQGPIGLTGLQGSQGSAGTNGLQGPQGIQGTNGILGTTGSQGNQGFQGEMGLQGHLGTQGDIGLTGLQGPQGWQGMTGTTGAQGPQGNQGWQGNQGNQGLTGLQGPQGWQGMTGTTGPQGFEGLQGPQGWQGNQGFQGWQGSLGPTGTVNYESGAFGTINASGANLLYITSTTFTGTNIFTNSLESSSSTLNIATSDSKTSTLNIGTSNSVQTINLGTVGSGQTTINIGGAGDQVRIAGDLVYINSSVDVVTNPYIILNNGSTTINNAGIIIAETGYTSAEVGGSTGAYFLVNSTSDGWVAKAGTGAVVNLNQNIGTGASPVFTNLYATLDVVADSIKVTNSITGTNLFAQSSNLINVETTNFTGTNIKGINLVTTNFTGTNLQTINQVVTNFTGANLQTTNQVVTNFTGTNLASTNIVTTNFTGTNLQTTNQVVTYFTGANVNVTNYTGTNLASTNIVTTNFTGTNVKSTNIVTTTFTGTNIYASTQFLAQTSDSVTNPGYSWSGDLNSGLYHPAEDTIGMVTAGSERIRVTSAGYVGIGVTSPTGILHVGSADNTNQDYVVFGNYALSSTPSAFANYNRQVSLLGNFNAGYNMGGTATTGSIKLYIGNYNNDAPETANMYPLVCEDENGYTDFFIKSQTVAGSFDSVAYFGGRIGIGTTGPAQKLTICDEQAPLLRFERNGAGRYDFEIGMSGTADFIFRGGSDNTGSNLTELMKLTGGGNLGIGTSTPNAPLQFANTIANRKVVLYEDTNNDHQYSGFGINSYMLRYQVGSSSHSHVFYAGASTTTSTELMRIKGDGTVGIGTSNPGGLLELFNSNGGNTVQTMFKTTWTSDWYLKLDQHHISGDRVNYYFRQNVNNVLYPVLTFDLGNVGIGLTGALTKLHISGSTNSAQATYIKVQNALNQSNGAIFGQDASNNVLVYNQANAVMAFATNNTERMRLSADGRLCIGTAPSGDTDMSVIVNGRTVQYGTSFTLGGNTSNFYPVAILTSASWGTTNTYSFTISRSNVHLNGYNYGSLTFNVNGHNTQWGNGADYLNYSFTQSYWSTFTRFVANCQQDGTSMYVIIWLRGALTYYFSGEGCSLTFSNTQGTSYTVPAGNSTTYTSTTSITAEFNFAYGSRDQLSGIYSSSGSIAIGSSSPSEKLLVVNSTNSTINGAPCTKILKDIGSNDWLSYQHKTQLEVGRYSDYKSLAIGVLDNGTACLQAKEIYVGYNNLSLNPIQGNVGIGTTTPNVKLDIASTSAGSIYLQNNSANGATRSITAGVTTNEINGGSSWGSDAGQLRLSAGGGTTAGTKAYIDLYGYNSQFIAFGANGTEQMRLISDGKVGIGTSSPGYKLTVNQSGYGIIQTDGTVNAGIYVGGSVGWFGTQNNYPTALFVNNGSPKVYIATSGYVAIGDTTVRQSSGLTISHTGTTYPNGLWVDAPSLGNGGSVSFVMGKGDSASYNQLQMGFVYNSNGSSSNYGVLQLNTVGSIITFHGTARVGINTYTPGYTLDVQGGDINASGSVRSNGTALTSDQRIKTDIMDLTPQYCLNKVKQFQVKQYNYISPWTNSGTGVVGFIAQQVAEVDPNCVTYQTNFIPNINQNIQPTLTNTIFLNTEQDNTTPSKYIYTFPLPSQKAQDLSINDLLQMYNPVRSQTSSNVPIICTIQNMTPQNNDVLVEISCSSALLETMYLFGKQITDFNYLDKNRIFAYTVGAIQDISSDLDQLEQQNITLYNQVTQDVKDIAQLKTQVQTLTDQKNQLSQNIQSLQYVNDVLIDELKDSKTKFSQLVEILKTMTTDQNVISSLQALQ